MTIECHENDDTVKFHSAIENKLEQHNSIRQKTLSMNHYHFKDARLNYLVSLRLKPMGIKLDMIVLLFFGIL